MDFIPSTYCAWKPLGGNDKNDSRANRQLNKKSLEFDHEKEKRRFHKNSLRYQFHKLGIIYNKETGFLKSNEVPEHFLQVEADLFANVYQDKENIMKI